MEWVDSPPDWMKILVIDDDPLILEAVRRMFRDTGIAVVTARDGRRGIANFREHRPGVVVTDLYMPEMDGLEAVREIRAVDPDVFVVVMSGGLQPNETSLLNASLALGADATLQKPFRFHQLDSLINQALDQAEARMLAVA